MATVIRGDDNFDTAYAKSVAVIADVKAINVDGGGATSGAWYTRDLNTELSDIAGITSISSNQITIQAGTYLIEWSAPAYAVNRHTTRLQNITTSSTQAEGSSAYANTTGATGSTSTGSTVVTLSSANVFEVQHRVDATQGTNGLGVKSTVQNSVYTLVKIHKIGA